MSTGREFRLDNEGHEGIVKSEKNKKVGKNPLLTFILRIDCTNNVSKKILRRHQNYASTQKDEKKHGRGEYIHESEKPVLGCVFLFSWPAVQEGRHVSHL